MTYNMPALYWLAKKDPDAALTVFHRLRDDACNYGAEAVPRYLDPRDRNADDAETHDVPDEPLTSESMAEPVQDGPDELNIDMLHEIKPGIHTMLCAAGGVAWPWSGTRVTTSDGKIVWRGEPWAYNYTHAVEFDGFTDRLDGLTFYMRPGARRGIEGGLLVSYIDASGVVQKPAYVASKPRGGKRPHRTKEAGEAYRARSAAIASPLHANGYQRPMSGEPALIPMLTPLAGVEDNRRVLAALYAKGNLPPVTVCPPAIAKGVHFIAGIVGAKQTASVSAPAWQEREVKALDPVLEEVAARGTLESIGIRLGKRGGYADRAGGRALLEAGRALVAANDNRKFEQNVA